MEKVVRIIARPGEVSMKRRSLVISERTLTSPLLLPRKELILDSRDWDEEVRVHGTSFLALAPTLMTGPSAVPGVTTAMIYWTTDIPAYHRARVKISGGAWSYSAWSITPSTNAAVPLSGLVPENMRHYVDVQSCVVGDGSAAFDWTPADDSFYFNTLCSGTFGMANWSATKGGFGKLTYLRLAWTTTVDMYYAQTDSPTLALRAAWNSSDTTHNYNFMSFDFSRPGTYRWRTRNRNKCFVWCGYSAYKYFEIGAGGDVDREWG